MLFIFAAIENENDRSKLEKLYEKYEDDMYHKAFSILQDQRDAEDAVQNAFLRIMHHLEKIQEPFGDAAKWYVLEASKNAAIDLYWVKKRKMSREERFDETIPYDDPMERYHGENRVIERIMKLSARDKDILMLKYVYGYRYDEVAELLAIPESTAKKAGERAKVKLEKICREEGILS